MVNAVIFDMDGTLIDTERLYMQYWMQILQDLGYELPYERALELRGLGKSKINEMFRAMFGIKFDYENAASRIKKMLEQEIMKNGLPKKAGADEILMYLKLKGYKTAVATSTPYDRASYLLKVAGLAGMFDHIISAESVKRGKPFPDVYEYVCRQLGEMPADCIAVEDAPNGVISGAEAGCKVVMVPDLTEPDEKINRMLFARVDCLDDLISLLPRTAGQD